MDTVGAKVADDADIAQAATERGLEDALAAHFRRSRLPAQSTPARTDCIDCGYEIPQRRREASRGCIRCRDCQEILEGFKGNMR